MKDTRLRNKAKNTKYFTYYNRNPYKQATTDCVIRAISSALDIPYTNVVMDFAKIQCETGLDPSEKETFSKYLEDHGWFKRKEPRHYDNTKYITRDFIDENPGLTCIAKLGNNHLAYINNGVVLDIWNSSNEVIHSYWIHE